MVADTFPPPAGRVLPRAITALLQLLVAAAAVVALYWLSLRLFAAVFAEGNHSYGRAPWLGSPVIASALSGLSALPLVALAALWLRDLGGAPVPRALPRLTQAVLAAWSWLLAALVLATLIYLAIALLLPDRSFLVPDDGSEWTLANALRLALAHDLLMLVLWLLCLPRALARLCELPWHGLRPRSFGQRLACLALLSLPAFATFAVQLLLPSVLDDALLFLDPHSAPWRFLALLYAEAVGIVLLCALALLAVWRLLRPGLHKGVSAA